MVPLYPGDPVRIVSWSPNFNGMRGRVVDPKPSVGRVLVRLEGDVDGTLFFSGEVLPLELDSIPMTGAE